MNRRPHTPPRAPLGVCVLVAVLAAAALAGAAWSGLVVLTAHRYDEATASLSANLEAASKDDADLDRLAAAQRRTDALFEQARSLSAVMPSSVSGPLAANADVSRRLSALIDAALAEQRGGSSSSESQGDDQSGNDGTQTEQGLSEEQRRQVDELLEGNRQLATSSPTAMSTQSADPTSAPSEQSGVKPW
ncbi:cell surface protein [Bifidobacterium sp. DSM 109958]|uniref:Cell surface protein n=1 Tax=Bifidobacterium moraviense TaxID=2675323 RepID=A0A7Y0F2M1_9BIFI|nr:cell surface protein [Bifidobacterium sp. DSM 109958]